MWRNDELCRWATDEGSWAQRGPDGVKVHRLHVFSACFPCYIIALCDSAVSLCYHSEGRSQEEVTWASIDNSLILADVTKGVLTTAAVRDEWKTLQTQKSENCQRIKYEMCSWLLHYLIAKMHKVCSHWELCKNAVYYFHTGNSPQDECETCHNGVAGLLAKVSLCRLATVSSS